MTDSEKEYFNEIFEFLNARTITLDQKIEVIKHIEQQRHNKEIESTLERFIDVFDNKWFT